MSEVFSPVEDKDLDDSLTKEMAAIELAPDTLPRPQKVLPEVYKAQGSNIYKDATAPLPKFEYPNAPLAKTPQQMLIEQSAKARRSKAIQALSFAEYSKAAGYINPAEDDVIKNAQAQGFDAETISNIKSNFHRNRLVEAQNKYGILPPDLLKSPLAMQYLDVNTYKDFVSALSFWEQMGYEPYGGTISRSVDRRSWARDLNEAYRNKQIDYQTYFNLLEKNNILTERQSDNAALSFLAEIGTDLVYAPVDNPIATVGGLLTTAATGNPMFLAMGLNAAYSIDAFDQAKSEIAANAQALNPELSQDLALNKANVGAGLIGLINAFGGKVIGDTFAKTGRALFTTSGKKALDKSARDTIANQTIGRSITDNAAEQSTSSLGRLTKAQIINTKKQLIANNIDNIVKSYLHSTAVEGVTEGLQGGIQQLSTNLLGSTNQQLKDDPLKIFDDVGSAFIENGVLGAVASGSFSIPASSLNIGYNVHRINKAVDSLTSNLVDEVANSVLQGSKLAQENPDKMADLVNEAAPNKFYYFDPDEVVQRAEEVGIDLNSLGGDFENAYTKQETGEFVKVKAGDWLKISMSEEGKALADLRQHSEEGLSSLDAGARLSDEERQKVREMVVQAMQEQANFDDAKHSQLEAIRTDVYSSLTRGTKVSSKNADLLSNTLTAMFNSVSELTGIEPQELYNTYKPTFRLFDDARYLNQEGNLDQPEGVVGTTNLSDLSIAYDPNADFATQLHEIAHYFLGMMSALNQKHINNKVDKAFTYFERWASGQNPSLKGKHWTDLSKEEQKQLHENFVYSFLDYVISGKAPSENIRPMFENLKQTLKLAERQRHKDFLTQRQQGSAIDYSELVRRDYQSRFGVAMPERDHNFDYFMNRLFTADELFRQLDNDYPLQSSFAFVDLEKTGLTPEQIQKILQLEGDVETIRRDAQNAIDSLLGYDAGLMIATGEKLEKRLDTLSKVEGRRDLKRFLTNTLEARKIYKEELHKAVAYVASTKLGQYIETLSNYKLDEENLKTYVRNGSLSQREFNILKKHGFVVAEGGSTVSFISSFYKGWDERFPTETKNSLRQGLNIIKAVAQTPDLKILARRMALKETLRKVKDSQKFINADKLQNTALVLSARKRLLQKDAKLLSEITNTVFDSDDFISAIAKQIIAKKQIRDLNQRHFYSLANKAGAKARKAIINGNFTDAARYKRTERLNITLAELAFKQRQNVLRSTSKMQKLFGRTDKSLSKTYDLNIMQLGRAMLGNIGLARRISMADIERMFDDFPIVEEIYNKFKDEIETANYYENLTVEQIEHLNETLADIAQNAKNFKSFQVGDKLRDRAVMLSEMIKTLIYKKTKNGGYSTEERPDYTLNRKVKAKDGDGNTIDGVSFSGSSASKINRSLRRSLRRSLARVETEVYVIDGKLHGIWHQMVYEPVRDALTRCKRTNIDFTARMNKALNSFDYKQGLLQSSFLKDRNGDNYIFGANTEYNNCGALEVFGLLLHTGNDSNYSKLLGGYGWTDQDIVNAINEWIQLGVIDEKMLDAVQALWDVYDDAFKLAQKSHYQLHGYYIKEVAKRPIVFTLKDGTQKRLKGGYAPARTNKDIVFDNQSILRDLENLEQNFTEAYPKAYDGMFIERNERYRRELDLNPANLCKQVSKVLIYAEMQPAVTQVNNLFKTKEMKDALAHKDPLLYEDLIKPFLINAARNSLNRPVVDSVTNSVVSGFVRGVGRAIMCLNLSNAIQQVTGIVAAGTLVKPKYLIDGVTEAGTHYKETVDFLTENSEYFLTRLKENDSHIEDTLEDICFNPSVMHGKAKGKALIKQTQKLSQRHAYLLQKIVQNRVDVAVGFAAYKQAIEQGKNLHDAIKEAESVVRLTQSSYDVTDVSQIEGGNAIYKAVTQFFNYFYTQMNLQIAELRRLTGITDETALNKTIRMAAFAFMGIYAPAVISDALVKSASGDWWSDEEDTSLMAIDTLLGAPLKSMVNAVPLAGNLFTSQWNKYVLDKYYYNEAISIPVFTTFQSGWHSITDIVSGKDLQGKDIRNIMMVLSVFLGMPHLAFIGREIGVSTDWALGNAEPTSWEDAIRTVLTGRFSQDARK